MNIFEEAIIPETPKAIPNEQLFIYVPIGTIENPGIVTFDPNEFKVDANGRVYMKTSSTANAKDISDIFALLYGYREGEPAEGREPGPVMASVLASSGNVINRITETGNGGNVDVAIKNNTIYSISGYDTITILPPKGNYTAHLFVEFPAGSEAVSFVLPEGMETSGNDPADAEKGDKWEVSLDSMGGAIFLRKAAS